MGSLTSWSSVCKVTVERRVGGRVSYGILSCTGMPVEKCVGVGIVHNDRAPLDRKSWEK